MENIVQNILYVHIFVGGAALISGLAAISSKKGRRLHRKAGRMYFWAMTAVFITGIIVAGFRFNRFLFLIAFLSYYSVFAGVRILKLKNLHKGQSPKWYDWTAGIVNALANVIFMALGLYYYFNSGNVAGSLLSIGFGVGGFLISCVNLKPFVVRPNKAYHWYMAHIGNMMGGYIATVTAFISTMVTRFDVMNPFIAFALPSLIGVPLLIFWQKRMEKSFQKPIEK